MARQTSTKFASYFDTLMRYYVVNYRDASPQLILRYAHRSPNFGKTTQGTHVSFEGNLCIKNFEQLSFNFLI